MSLVVAMENTWTGHRKLSSWPYRGWPARRPVRLPRISLASLTSGTILREEDRRRVLPAGRRGEDGVGSDPPPYDVRLSGCDGAPVIDTSEDAPLLTPLAITGTPRRPVWRRPGSASSCPSWEDDMGWRRVSVQQLDQR
jgi:hypothetical protein